MKSRLLKLFALLSQAMQVIIFNGSPDETISGRAYRQGYLLGDRRWLKSRNLINRVFFWQPDHCRASHKKDVEFAKMIMDSGPG